MTPEFTDFIWLHHHLPYVEYYNSAALNSICLKLIILQFLFVYIIIFNIVFSHPMLKQLIPNVFLLFLFMLCIAAFIMVIPDYSAAAGNFGEKASNVIIQRYVCIQPTISRGLTTIIYQITSLGDRKKKTNNPGATTFTALWLTVKQEHCVPACCVAFYTTRLQMCFIS